GAAPDLALYAELRSRGFRLWVDAGVRRAADARPVADAGAWGIVAGLETLAGPDALAQLIREFGDRIRFSLDLKEGRPLGHLAAWGTAEAWPLAVRAVACGVRRVIVLDLARVGLDGGTGTEELCARLVAAFPDVEVTAGGGVRDVQDLERLAASGV